MSYQREQHPLVRRFVANPPVLEGGVGLQVHPDGPNHARVRLEHGGNAAEFLAAPLSVPYPSGLKRLMGSDPRLEGVLVEKASRGLDEAARAQAISYLDAEGHGRVVRPGFVFVSPPGRRRGRQRVPALDPYPPRLSPAIDSRSGRPVSASAFAEKGSRVVRGLLASPGGGRRLSDLVDEVDLSPGHVHRVLSGLVEDGFVERDGNEYVVADPGSLLEAWAQNNRPRRKQISLSVPDHVGMSVAELVQKAGPAAVVSGELAAEIIHPHLPARNAIVHFVDEEAWEQHAVPFRSLAPPVRGSGRLFIDLADPGVARYGAEHHGLPLVHPVQIYVDLYRDRGRGREAAEEMRRRVIGF
jgi:hypothetical protein